MKNKKLINGFIKPFMSNFDGDPSINIKEIFYAGNVFGYIIYIK